MVAYPARLAAEGENRVMLTMPDIPEFVLVAEAEDEALERAPGLLHAILAAYRAGERPLPRASRISGAPLVTAKRNCMAMME
jgi:predicted RNase H-like HicB family nuclease